MKKNHTSRNITAALFSLLALFATQKPAQAVFASAWEDIGTAPFGGRLIIGTGTADVGTLASFTPANTSLPGNYVVLFAGSTASGASAATVQFTTDGNTFVNNGIVNAPNFDAPSIPFANTGVAYFSDGTLTNQLLFNTGTINGGFGNSNQAIIGAGAGFLGVEGVDNVFAVNTGSIFGGSGSLEEGEDLPLSIGDALVIFDANETGQDINGVVVVNSGVMIAGNDSSVAISIDNGVSVIGLGNVSNVSFYNTPTGFISGGNTDFEQSEVQPSAQGYFTGNGVVIAAGPLPGAGDIDFFSGYSLDTVGFANQGTILGGSGNDNSSFDTPFVTNYDNFAPGYANASGNGTLLWALNGVFNVGFINTGNIVGGDNNEGGDYFETEGTFGSMIGNGVGIFDANNLDEENETDIAGVSIFNSGLMAGGNGNENGVSVGSGYGIVGFGNVSDISLVNAPTGVIRGGNLNKGTSEEEDPFNAPYPSLTGVGFGVSAGFDFNNPFNFFTVDNVSIVNYGSIIGGDDNKGGNFQSVAVGAGAMIAGNNGVTNVMVDNHGVIQGGNNNFDAFFAGSGLGIFDANQGGNNFEINNITILNTGLIAGGTNNSDSNENGFGSAGVDIFGFGVVRNILIHNEESGVIRGGNGGPGTNLFGGEEEIYGPTNGGDGIFIGSSGSVKVINDILPQIELDGTDVQSGNIVIANCGYIIGGDAFVTDSGSRTGTNPGIGIHTEVDGVTIYNWGVVQGGKDVNGNFGTAIQIEGLNSTLNLNGHSSVLGKITSFDPNNVLNLNFTGVSPLVKAQLYNSLAAQGVFSASPPSTYTFDLRGVHYVVDPFVTHFNVTSYQELALSPNAKAVGASLDSITYNPTGQLLAMYNALDGGCGPFNPNPAFTTEALEELSGQINSQVYTEIGFSVFDFTALEITTRLNNLRKGSESFSGEFSDNSGLGGDDGTTTAGFDPKDGKGGKEVINSNNKRWGYFVRGGGIFGQFEGHDGVPSQHFTNAGVVLGVDARVTDHVLIGALFNYSHTTATTDAFGSMARADSFGGGLYAGYKNGGWYANTLATYDHHNYDTSRVISLLGVQALGSPDGNQYGANLDGGYDFKLTDNLTAGPLAGLQFVHIDVDGYTETGAGAANLAVGAQSANSLRSRLGFRLEYTKTLTKEVNFASEVRVAWQHEFLDDSRNINSAFAGSGLAPFSIKTLAPERDAALLGVGVNFTVRDRATFYVDFDVQVGQEHYTEESVRGGVKLSF